MTDKEQLEQYRRMTPGERWEMWAELSELGMAIWDANLDAAQIETRWKVWKREHDRSDANMLRVFRECAP